MKKFLLILLMCFVTSCLKTIIVEPSFPYGGVTLNVITKMHDEILGELNDDFHGNMVYEWDDAQYGKIVKGVVDTIVCYAIDSKTKKIISQMEVVRGNPKEIVADGDYDLLVHNKTKTAKYSYSNDAFLSKTTETKSEPLFDYEEVLPKINQCEEQYVIYQPHLLSQIDYNDESKFIRNEDSTSHYIYDYYIDEKLTPCSFVYVVQVVIYNDAETIPMSVVTCNYIGINGVSMGMDLIKHEASKERGLVESFNVKPFQHHGAYSVCCEKFITYGYPVTTSSWEDINKCEIGLEFTLSDGSKKRGRANIASKMKEKPYGGVLTIILNNSDISKEVTPTSGLDIEVEQWDTYEFDIPF